MKTKSYQENESLLDIIKSVLTALWIKAGRHNITYFIKINLSKYHFLIDSECVINSAVGDCGSRIFIRENIVNYSHTVVISLVRKLAKKYVDGSNTPVKIELSMFDPLLSIKL